jgi:hypothetical protein
MQPFEPSIRWTVDLRGVLAYLNVAPTVRPLIDGDDRFPVAMQWMIFIKDHAYTLRFESPELETRARNLIDKPVIVSGDFDGDIVTVRRIEADDATSIDKNVQVEAIGTLTHTLRPVKLLDPKVPNPDPNMWILECDGKSYELNLPASFEQRAAMLCNSTVLLRGRRNGAQIEVEDLISVALQKRTFEAQW